jgi:dynein heavy chain
MWTAETTQNFEDLAGGSENAMKEGLKLIEGRIFELIKRVREDLPSNERNKIVNVITIDVHSRDCVDKLIVNKLQEVECWWWL